MRLESIDISRYSWDRNSPLRGKIKFSNQSDSTVEIALTDEQLQGVLAVVASALVEASKTVAATLTAEVIEQAAQATALPAP